MLFAFFWYNAVRPLINGNAVIIVALLLVGAFWAIKEHADELAGVLLAFSTIKPQVVVLLLAFVVFYAAVNGRWRLIVWLVGTVVILSGAAMFLMPDWIQQNIHEVLRYPGYNPPGTPGAALAVWMPAIGQKIGYAFTAGVALTLLVEWIAARKADFKGFLWAASLTLVLSPWSGIQNDPGNFIVLFPAVTMIFALLDDRWRRSGWLFSLGLIVTISGRLVVDFPQYPRNRERAAATKPGDVLPAAGLVAGAFILGTLVGFSSTKHVVQYALRA